MDNTVIDWTGWSEWHNLLSWQWSQVKTIPGAYAIATKRRLHRAVGIDPEGILHIGESARVADRIWAFRKSAQGKGWLHMAGGRYHYFELAQHFRLESLRVRWIEKRTKEEAYKAEACVLDQYRRRHFELPPLNYKFNWAHEE